MRQKLILTAGLPRSGKSTWAKKQSFPVVNPDSVRLAMHGKAFIKEAEELVWAHTHIMAKALFIAGHEVVIIDATNNTARRRNQWIAMFPEQDVSVVYFDTSAEECIKRAEKDNRPDLIPIIRSMDEKRNEEKEKNASIPGPSKENS